MELYILDSLLRRVAVVDKFESLIWTERFSDIGDFQLDIHSTVESRSLLVPDLKLACNVSQRLMVTETIENKVDADGKQLLTIKGRSLEKLLEDRVAKDTQSDLTTEPTWTLTGTPGAIARQIFQDICVTGNLNAADIIPYYAAGTNFPADTIGEPTTVITKTLEPQTVLQAIKDICDQYDMGFRLYRNGDSSQIYFNIYAGRDLTTAQTSLPAVVFSPNLDNLQNTSELTTTQLYKNVAYVYSPVGFRVVIPDGVDPSISGFERRVLMVKADDITSTVPATANALMDQRGLQELSKNRRMSAFDGEINQNSQYKYGVHYNLGDLVEMQNIDGVTNNMQVTEQIFVSDKEGERSYPTLTINQFIQPGSWIAWDFNQKWIDLDSSMTAWADQI